MNAAGTAQTTLIHVCRNVYEHPTIGLSLAEHAWTTCYTVLGQKTTAGEVAPLAGVSPARGRLQNAGSKEFKARNPLKGRVDHPTTLRCRKVAGLLRRDDLAI